MVKKEIINATNVKRVPSSGELFTVGKQPSIPTRGFSSILSDKPSRRPLFKYNIKELKNNNLEHLDDGLESKRKHVFF